MAGKPWAAAVGDRLLRCYRWLFPARMTQARVAWRFGIGFAIYVGWWLIGLLTGLLAPYWMLATGFSALYPSLTLALLPVPAGLLAFSSVAHRRYNQDVAQWREQALKLVGLVRETVRGNDDAQRVLCWQILSTGQNLETLGRAVPGHSEAHRALRRVVRYAECANGIRDGRIRPGGPVPRSLKLDPKNTRWSEYAAGRAQEVMRDWADELEGLAKKLG